MERFVESDYSSRGRGHLPDPVESYYGLFKERAREWRCLCVVRGELRGFTLANPQDFVGSWAEARKSI